MIFKNTNEPLNSSYDLRKFLFSSDTAVIIFSKFSLFVFMDSLFSNSLRKIFSKVYSLIFSSPNSGRTLDIYFENNGLGEITITLLALSFKFKP